MKTDKYTNTIRKIYHHPDLMIEMLSANRFQLYTREYGICAFVDATPWKKTKATRRYSPSELRNILNK